MEQSWPSDNLPPPRTPDGFVVYVSLIAIPREQIAETGRLSTRFQAGASRT